MIPSEKLIMFGFQRLDVYRRATEFLGASSEVVREIPRGNGELVDQLRRAALSIPLNIAEGTGRLNQDAHRSYAFARGSALECAAILDALEILGVAKPLTLTKPRELLERIVSMPTVLLRT